MSSYLFTCLFFLGIALGSLAFSMVHHLVGGLWGLAVRRILEAASLTLPLIFLLFVPIFFTLPAIYPWAHAELVTSDHILSARAPYLNPAFFIIRAIVFFAIWTALAFTLRRWSLRYDEHPTPVRSVAIQRLCAGGMLIYLLTMSFAAIDWILSRDPHYYSTIFGLIVVIGQATSALAFAILVLCLRHRDEPFRSRVTAQNFIDLGSLLETMVILFAYVAFAQFLVNWSGNSQQEISWYVRRTAGGWLVLASLILLFHFFVPFFLLLIRANKQRPSILGAIAAVLLVARLMDLYWMVRPPWQDEQPQLIVHWADFAAPIVIGAIWLAAFFWILSRQPLMPRYLVGAEELVSGETAA